MILVMMSGCGGSHQPRLEVRNRQQQLEGVLKSLMGLGTKEVAIRMDREMGMEGVIYSPLQWARDRVGNSDRGKAIDHVNDLMGTKDVSYDPGGIEILFYEKEYGKRHHFNRKVVTGRLIEEFEEIEMYDLVYIVFEKGKMAGWKVKVSR